MTYAALLAHTNTIRAGDRVGAEQICSEITLLLDAGSEDLTDDGRRYLYKIRKKWTARADGSDTRWQSRGSQPGRGKSSSRRGSATVRNEEEHDPLLARLIQKFGTPLRGDS